MHCRCERVVFAKRGHGLVLGIIVGMTRRELRRENDELRAALELRGYRTIEDWEALQPARRDPLAARAFISEWGDKGRALIRLGFPAMNKLPRNGIHLYKDHVTRVFDTPGVQAILKRDLGRIDPDREAMLSRLSWIGLHGPDDQSVRAIDLLAKVCGWHWHPPLPSTHAAADLDALFIQTNGDAT
jgi:hypothetical protein